MLQSTFITAVAKHKSGNFAEAKKLYVEILQQSPQDFDVLHLSGLAAYQSHQYDDAEHFFSRALEIGLNFAPLLLNFSLLLQDLGRFSEVVKFCDKAIEIDPGYMEAYFNRGLGHKSLKNYVEARSRCWLAAYGNVVRNDICSHVTKAETAGAQWLYPASRSTALGFGQCCFSDFTKPTR